MSKVLYKLDDETLNEIGDRLDRRERFLTGKYKIKDLGAASVDRAKKTVSNTADSDIYKLESLVDFSTDNVKRTAERLILETDSAYKLEKITIYLAEQGIHGQELVSDLLKKYLETTGPSESSEKFKRAVMLVAKYGDLDTYKKYQDKFWKDIESNKIYTNESGKNILHYACQSENAELVKLIADKFSKTHNINNPFAVKDIPEKDKNYSLSHSKYMSYLNYVRPQHYISHNLAAQLDHLYNLDGAKRGSFTSMTNYYTKIRKVVDQSIFGYFGAKASKDEGAARSAIYSAKYVGGIGVVKYNAAITAADGMMAANLAASVFIGSAVLLNSAVIFGTNFYLRTRRSKQLGYSPDLVLDANEQEKQAANKIRKYSGKNKHDLKQALTYSDFKKVNEIVLSEKEKPTIPTTKKLIDRVRKIHYFPNHELKLNFFQVLANAAKPKELESLIDDLSNRSKEDKALIKNILKNLLEEKGVDQAVIKRIALLAAELGDYKLLKSATSKLSSDAKLLSITDEKGSNLMHYACRNGGNASIISEVEKLLTPEFEKLAESAITDKAFGKEIGKAKTIFDLSNKRGEKPKDFISRATANELDLLSGVDPETGYGFSRFVNSRRLGKMREERSFLGGAASGLAVLTGMVCVIVPPAIELGWKAASAMHAGPAGLLIATAVETACTVAICELTERIIIPLIGKSINHLENELDKLCNGPNPTIDAFSKIAAEKSFEKANIISHNLQAEPKPKNIKEIAERIVKSMEGISEDTKKAISSEIEKMVTTSFKKKPFAQAKTFEEKLALLENSFAAYASNQVKQKDLNLEEGKSVKALPTISHFEKLAASDIIHTISSPDATPAGKKALKQSKRR